MSVPSPIVAQPPVIRRAKKAKFCKLCGERIPAGTAYALVDAWTWCHPRCLRVPS